MTGMELVKRKGSKKGYVALGAATGTVVLFAIGWWWFGALGILASAGLIHGWWKHRASWSMRF